jgi:hypothetical protein
LLSSGYGRLSCIIISRIIISCITINFFGCYLISFFISSGLSSFGYSFGFISIGFSNFRP